MTERSFEFVEHQIHIIQEKIKAAAICSGRNESDITFMAVTKTVSPDLINHAIDLGIRVIGENRVQEYLSKRDDYHLSGVSVHFIGSLQRNKVRQICDKVDSIDSVNSLALAQEIQNQCEKIRKIMPVLIEVNIGKEQTKTGIGPDEVLDLLQEISIMPNLKVEGLMAIPPFTADIEEKRMYCHEMKKLFVDIKEKNIHNITMSRLSMGMSDDFEQAILEGTTEIRIGSALFGHRDHI